MSAENLIVQYEKYCDIMKKVADTSIVERLSDEIGERLVMAPRGLTVEDGGTPGALIEFSLAVASAAKALSNHFGDAKSLVKVFILKNWFEADIIKGELEKEGIPVLIRSFRDTAYDGIYIPQKGWGEVRVPEKDKKRAEEIIDILEKAFEKGEVGIPENEELIACPHCEQEISLESKVCPLCGKKLTDA